MAKRYFENGQSAYTCEDCGKKTRNTGKTGGASVGLCDHCYEVAEWINYVSDGGDIADVDEPYRADVAAALGLKTE